MAGGNALRIEFAPALMTRELAAYYLQISLSDLDALRAKRELTPVGGTKRVKFRKSDLDEYVERLPERATANDAS